VKAYLKNWVDELKQTTHAQNVLSASKPTQPAALPLTDQIDQLFAEMPRDQRTRAWSINELARLLQGKYRAHPHPQKIAPILRSMGWVTTRCWGADGYGKRLWHSSNSKK